MRKYRSLSRWRGKDFGRGKRPFRHFKAGFSARLRSHKTRRNYRR